MYGKIHTRFQLLAPNFEMKLNTYYNNCSNSECLSLGYAKKYQDVLMCQGE